MLYLLFPVIHLTFLYGHYPLHLLVLGTGTNVTSAFALLRLYFFFLFFLFDGFGNQKPEHSELVTRFTPNQNKESDR